MIGKKLCVMTGAIGLKLNLIKFHADKIYGIIELL
jgi:hypothetical protein